ncbi:MAG TPA: DUF3291 domain-containing protein [Chloroflexia bacterium]|nr:DUF3291 domain-containing protein [Chloroflexia bacterium]
MDENIKSYHLAQINIARMRAPLEDPLMAGFVSKLDEINALAEKSSGFIWRLQTPDGNATAIKAFEGQMIIVNLTVWETLESLHHYVYRSQHSQIFRNRKEWFEPLSTPALALWWVPAGELPTVEEGKYRLQLLAEKGPTPLAFTFKASFAPPDAVPAEFGH